jgi:anti-sigma-K factor RskA
MNYDTHPQLDRLVADYVLGTMPPRVRRRLEAVMRRSPVVQAAVDAWSDRLHLLSRVESHLDPSPALFARIERRIDQTTPSTAAARGAHRAPLWGWLRPAAGFAFGVMLTLALTTLQWPVFETLTSAPPAATVQRQTLRLLFAPGATVEQMNAALRAVDANVVAGPTPLGLYTVSVADAQPLERALATLRAQPVVRFAEPVVAPKAPR